MDTDNTDPTVGEARCPLHMRPLDSTDRCEQCTLERAAAAALDRSLERPEARRRSDAHIHTPSPGDTDYIGGPTVVDDQPIPYRPSDRYELERRAGAS